MSALGKINIRDFISQEKYIANLAVYNIARSSISIEEEMTVFCLFALYATAPSYNIII